MEHDERVSLLTKKRVVFYYKLENGHLGRTNESINKKRIVTNGNSFIFKHSNEYFLFRLTNTYF